MKKINTVLLIKGPDNPFPFFSSLVKTLKKQGITVYIVGDGTHNIKIYEIEACLKKIKSDFIVIGNFHGWRPVLKGRQDPRLKNRKSLELITKKIDDLSAQKSVFQERYDQLLGKTFDGSGEIFLAKKHKLKSLKNKVNQFGLKLKEQFIQQSQIIKKMVDLSRKGMNEADLQKKLLIQLNDKYFTLTMFFKLIRKHHPNSRYDVILGNCYGAFGHQIAGKYLHAKAGLMTWGLQTQPIHVDVFSSFISSFKKNNIISSFYKKNITAEKGFIQYLAFDFDNDDLGLYVRYIPTLTLNGKTFYPEKNLKFGQVFTEAEQKIINSQLGDLVQKQKLSKQIKKLQLASSVEEVRKSGGYGLSLAIAYLLKK